MQRAISLDQIRSAEKAFDFVIIGGGATGLGAAVDAASRGHSVVLVEQSDFAKGTSSRSTKLVHGGVRYLRQGNIALVREALRERGRLAKNAPHLVRDRAFVIPGYHWWEEPFYGVGMKVYDHLAGRLGLKPSHMLNREETIMRIPTIEREHLTGGVVYHDGQFDDSRLAINLAQTAEERGAALVNYCACIGFLKADGSISGIVTRDEESGETFEIKARAVINATGVFVHDVRRFDDANARTLVAPSQGVHLVLPKEFLPGDAAIMIPKTDDGRVLFAVPWHDCVVVGTTDTPVVARSLEPRALPEERDFIMKQARKYLAKSPADSDVLSIFAGLRPLVKTDDAADTASLSREHAIVVSESGLITITGGKWTTYRQMAEDVIDRAEKIARVANRHCVTDSLRIHGAMEMTVSGNFAANFGAENLPTHFEFYGSDALQIKALADLQTELTERLHADLPYQKAEVVWHARHEMARTVEDVLARRTRSLLLNAKASIEAAPVVAEILARELGRNDAWKSAQITHYTALARGYVFTDPASLGHR